ncbi:MAG: hypothetical protein LH467_06710 [Gemmatimonadaceae bacterium]|nr:hypothetical protein [Gemmatimonadaceae bacterium]
MPNFLLLMLMAWAPWLLLGGGVLYIGVRYVRAVEIRSQDRAEIAALSGRVLALEESLLDVRAEKERALDIERFAAELRPGRASLLDRA